METAFYMTGWACGMVVIILVTVLTVLVIISAIAFAIREFLIPAISKKPDTSKPKPDDEEIIGSDVSQEDVDRFISAGLDLSPPVDPRLFVRPQTLY